jgi:hypothetical protein
VTFIHDKAKRKRVEFENRRSELNMPETEYNSKIAWLKRVEVGLEDDLEIPLVADREYNRHLLPIDLSKTRQIFYDTYDSEEFKTLCFDFAIEFDNLGGEGKKAKMREFVGIVARSEQILRLIVAITRKNKNIAWDSFH